MLKEQNIRFEGDIICLKEKYNIMKRGQQYRPLKEQIRFLSVDDLVETHAEIEEISQLIKLEIENRLKKKTQQLSDRDGDAFIRKMPKQFRFYQIQRLKAAEENIKCPFGIEDLPPPEEIRKMLTPEEIEWYEAKIKKQEGKKK